MLDSWGVLIGSGGDDAMVVVHCMTAAIRLVGVVDSRPHRVIFGR